MAAEIERKVKVEQVGPDEWQVVPSWAYSCVDGKRWYQDYLAVCRSRRIAEMIAEALNRYATAELLTASRLS